jgi:hypothetical protein
MRHDDEPADGAPGPVSATAPTAVDGHGVARSLRGLHRSPTGLSSESGSRLEQAEMNDHHTNHPAVDLDPGVRVGRLVATEADGDVLVRPGPRPRRQICQIYWQLTSVE